MKTSIKIIALLLFCKVGFAQDLTKIALDKILEKGKKLNLKLDAGNLQMFDFENNNKVYFLDFNGHTSRVYYKNGAVDAYAVLGDIYKMYDSFLYGQPQKGKDGRITAVNRQLYIGAPTSDEFKTPQKSGAGQHFEGGSMYYSQATGTHEIHGEILRKYKALGWENSFLGFPTTNETVTPDGYGRFNFFEGGCIYYHPNLGTFAMPKMITEIWKKNGWEKGKLGYPISDEIVKNNNSIQKFEFGAIISTKGGAYQVIYNGNRNIRGLYSKWLEIGGENSNLGDLITPNKHYPVDVTLHFAEFQKGFIYESFVWENNRTVQHYDAYVIRKGPIFDYYASKKWEQGYLGYPISDEEVSSKSAEEIRQQRFQHGTIYYTKSVGAFEKK